MDVSPTRTATDPAQLTATQAAQLIRDRKLSCEELARACLARIAKRDPVVKAWLSLDPDHVISRARALDKLPPTGPLHGLPLGVKDIIDTADYPTTQNSVIYDQLKVGRDAACVAVARGAGALILGKTDTVEFASSGRRALSTNPFNPAHTPGGSSSGSGAAVGDYQTPLAFGTQTGGSHIRPAAFNGIYALKPSWGLVSREGIRMSSITLDTLGWYGRSIDDLVLVGTAFHIPADPTPISIKDLRVGVCESPAWHAIEPAGATALATAAEKLAAAGAIVTPLTLPEPFNHLHDAHRAIIAGEGAAAFLPEYINAPNLLAPDLKSRVENPASRESWLAAYTLADSCRPQLDSLFGPNLDVILTPSAPGEAPLGLHTTGNAIFNSMWTLLHGPNINIPAGRGPNNLPTGITLVGPRMSDPHLLAIAHTIAPLIDTDAHSRLAELWGDVAGS